METLWAYVTVQYSPPEMNLYCHIIP
jgi:hypothetical protein